ncbi:hypothetical protein [Burkholderia sp. TSV86]|uniref:hypothetical protein n=1 Tax=Burkholderia sp. TSV86 TaxID=1385594 RepID=UPI00075DDE1C|nr:hypothetical protein [Burkholderia sp. TSV86]KVE39316.1 hypothetical protein WS68_21290 [Burkholderia sp. TSV86]
MKTVLACINRRKRAYARLPLFERLRDDDLPPRVRLSFMPEFAFFVMAFGDLNRYVLRKEPADDPHQAQVNAHTYEDDHHWSWFLEDIETLGWSGSTTATDALRALWRDDTCRCRMLMYDLCALVRAADGIERLAIVEAVEETGNVLFTLTTHIAQGMQGDVDRELRYMGLHHLALESGHLQHGEHAALGAIELSDDKRARCIELVDYVFDLFAAWTHEAQRHIERAMSREQPAPADAPLHAGGL